MQTNIEKVCVIGLGYIGLPTAAVLASRGLRVIGVDIDRNIVDTVNAGAVHIVEPDLQGLVKTVVSSGHLVARRVPEPADAFVIAVPTPFKGNHEPDLTFVHAAVAAVAPVLRRGNLVILESTCPVGTTELLARWLREARQDLIGSATQKGLLDLNIAYCPERVLPGKIMTELTRNDRVIGGLSPACAERAATLYRTFVTGQCFATNARTAEMCKLTENSFRDVNIAFANELATVCDELDVDVWEVIRLANRHPRVNILQPGPGVGGHCVAVDPWFIVHSSPKSARIIRAAREVNDARPAAIVRKVVAAAAGFVNPAIACLGLSFKADVDDLRESPALQIVERLDRMRVGKLYIAEPHIERLPEALSTGGASLVDWAHAVKQADIVLLLVNHKHFISLDTKTLDGKVLIDTRGVLKRAQEQSADVTKTDA